MPLQYFQQNCIPSAKNRNNCIAYAKVKKSLPMQTINKICIPSAKFEKLALTMQKLKRICILYAKNKKEFALPMQK